MFHRRQVVSAGAALAISPVAARAGVADRRIAALVEAFVAANVFEGVVMTGRAGRIDYARAFGLADREAGRGATVETRYGIASISKWLTTVAVLRLVERGRLALDAPVTRWLPYFRADTGARVTLRHLLSNTSGIPNAFVAAAKLDPALTRTQISATDAVRRYCQGDLQFEPGSRFDYALTNWFVVLAIVEAVTRQPFQDAIAALVLRPVGLNHTDAALESPDPARTAASYRGTPPQRMASDRLLVTAAGGGYFSTAGDLLRAAHRIWDGGFLAAESLREMRTIEAPADSYALGGRIRSLLIAGETRLAGWETGNAAGYRSVLGHRFDDRSTVVILNNTGLSQRTLDLFADSLFAAESPPA